MIDKVNNQKYYNYSKVNQQKRETTESAEFHMNLGKEGVIYEKSQKKPEKSQEAAINAEEQESGASSQRGGVKLEISNRGYEKSAREKQKSSLIEEVRKFAETAVNFLKSVWDKVWNDKPKETEFPEILEEQLAEQEGISEETGLILYGENDAFPGETGNREIISEQEGTGRTEELYHRKLSNQIAESIYTQEEIRQLFRRGNQKEIEDFLSNHGEKQLARNTDLLTQYDKRGSLVGLNSSDKDLILHGNKNQIKL